MPHHFVEKLNQQHTLGHLNCPACSWAKDQIMLLGKGIASDTAFAEAAQLWLLSLTFVGPARHRYIAPRTLRDYKSWIKALDRFFAGLHLDEIHVGHLREYQRLRASGELAPPPRKGRADHPEVGPNRINQELSLLVRIMKRANCWTAQLEDFYSPLLKEESDIPQALTPEQQSLFLAVAGSREHWQVVYWYALLGFATTMSNYELRGLRIGDVSLYQRMVMVRAEHAKRPGRIRTIPLTDDATWAVERLIERAKTLGATSPQHFLFPLRDRLTHLYDPNQPMTYWGIRKDWEEARAAAGLDWFTPHDVRHTSITRMAESGTPIQVIMSLSGHLSQRMSQHYTHISEQAKRMAVESVRPMRFPVKMSG